MKTVNQVLNNEVIERYCMNVNWSNELSEYLNTIIGALDMHVKIQYSNLLALESYDDYNNVDISEYLFFSTHNEIEKIFKSLTVEYKPNFNYYRNIIERNTGANTNTYSGSDTKELGGSDQVTSTNNLDVETTDSSNSKDYTTTYDDATENGFKPNQKNEYSDTKNEDYDEAYSSNTEYGKTETNTYGRVLTTGFGRNTTTEIEGNNGVYPFPDLIKKEYDLRIKHKLFDTIIMILIKKVSSGIWL